VFSISAKGVYGLTAVVELAARRHQGAVQIRDIANKYDIPQHYLEQILVTLKKVGLVESYRGAQGGYALAREPERVTVLEVLEHLEGRLQVINESRCGEALSFFWNSLSECIESQLTMSLDDLLRDKQQHEQAFTYVI